MGSVPMINRRPGMAETSSAGELTEAPQPKLLGSIDLDTMARTPTFAEDGPPPWEVDKSWLKHNTDARKFVDVPETWELRWLNPKTIDRAGFRDWQTVSASDPRVTLKVPSMRDPANLIRRGGQSGDILCYMPKHWVESRAKMKSEKAAKMMQSAVNRQEQFKEEARMGHFGPHISVGESKHPSHTMAEGKTMEKEVT